MKRAYLLKVGRKGKRQNSLRDILTMLNRGHFFDICSDEQDISLEKVGWSDGFQVTDIVYTDTTGGAKVPSSHLGMRLQKSDASLKSRDFFAVLGVVRDLLLVGPPPDVKELSILAAQEATQELKRRWRSNNPEEMNSIDDIFEHTTASNSFQMPIYSEPDSKLIKNYVEDILSK